jgi:hypothetical protein
MCVYEFVHLRSVRPLPLRAKASSSLLACGISPQREQPVRIRIRNPNKAVPLCQSASVSNILASCAVFTVHSAERRYSRASPKKSSLDASSEHGDDLQRHESVDKLSSIEEAINEGQTPLLQLLPSVASADSSTKTASLLASFFSPVAGAGPTQKALAPLQLQKLPQERTLPLDGATNDKARREKRETESRGSIEKGNKSKRRNSYKIDQPAVCCRHCLILATSAPHPNAV